MCDRVVNAGAMAMYILASRRAEVPAVQPLYHGSSLDPTAPSGTFHLPSPLAPTLDSHRLYAAREYQTSNGKGQL